MHRNLRAVLFLVDEIDGNFNDFLVLILASSNFRSVSTRARTRRSAVYVASNVHCRRVSSKKTTAERVNQRFDNIVTREKRVRIRKTAEFSKIFWKANDILIRTVSGRKSMAVKRAGKAALVVNTGRAQTARPSTDMFVVHLDETGASNFSAKATLRKNLAETRDESAFEEAVAHFILVK